MICDECRSEHGPVRDYSRTPGRGYFAGFQDGALGKMPAPGDSDAGAAGYDAGHCDGRAYSRAFALVRRPAAD